MPVVMRPPCKAVRAALVAAFLYPADPAAGQEPTLPADPPPAGSPEVVPEKIEPQRPIGPPPAREAQPQGEPAPNGFVIQPPSGIDPEMAAPPPDDGAAAGPVIKPPPPPQ
jgi:hypothetical protein